jgi:ubiquinone/menaquinone biosynthesis C-methylase UbiE
MHAVDTCNVCHSKTLAILDPDSHICGCEVCGFVFDNPRPTTEELVEFYSKPSKYDSWLAESAARDRLWDRRVARLLRTRKPGSLMDVGTGTGQFLIRARPFYTEVSGTEVSDSAVQIAAQRYGLSLYHGTIDEIDFGGRSFDNLTLFHVLEHVTDPAALIRKCHTLLNPDGVLVIAVPNDVDSLRARSKRFLYRLGLKRKGRAGSLGLPRITLDGTLDEIHLSHFTPSVLMRLLRQCGFSIAASGLDRHYVATGNAEFKQDMYYTACSVLHKITGINLYDTILVIAVKSAEA